jgi:glycosidase
MPLPHLQRLLGELRRLEELEKSSTARAAYALPALWFAPHHRNGRVVVQSPAATFATAIEQIINAPQQPQPTGPDRCTIYSLLVRYATAFDHDNSSGAEHEPWYTDSISASSALNTASITSNTKIASIASNTDTASAAHAELTALCTRDGWRCTGTFLKTILLLPYLKHLGINTLYVLPVFAPGQVHRKGSLGSVFAVRDLHALDPMLAEPLCALSAEEQFHAFVEACHHLGFKILCEFPLRTTSRDARWCTEHPEWYYWVRESAGRLQPPSFTDEQLSIIRSKVHRKDWRDLPQPGEAYRELFVDVPKGLATTHRDARGQVFAESGGGSRCEIPGAFADYPPDDSQPLWDDVTYLRLHNHPNFAYMAYNTIRMYDEHLRNSMYERSDLWQELSDVIPAYIRRFNIDGAVLDMSHALPDKLRSMIIKNARTLKPEFVFVEENFAREQESAALGFDAVLGDSWWHAGSVESLQEYVAKNEESTEENQTGIHTAMPVFAALDTHNTPRCATRIRRDELASAYATVFSLKNSIPMVLQGSEFGETTPINTGLLFSEEQLAMYPPQRLALFSAVRMMWENADLALRDEVRMLLLSSRM